MEKVLIFSTNVYVELSDAEKVEFNNIISWFVNKNVGIIFTSRDSRNKNLLTGVEFSQMVVFQEREAVRNFVQKYSKKYFIVIGDKDADLIFAANLKLMFLLPTWCRNPQSKASRYGLKVQSIFKLKKILEVILNQKSWFYRLDLDNRTTILSLTNANNYGASKNENEMIIGFREFLKHGNRGYYEVLLYHFLASIANNDEFRNVQDWAIFPSSGTELNSDMLEFKDKARVLMAGKKKEPIFIRHTPTWKSHENYDVTRNRLPADRHFETIVISDKYKGKLKGRTVCVFDDYLTNGTSFETARNLLLHEKVSKMFFVSLGKFHKNRQNQYYQQDFEICGDVNVPNGYTYKLINSKWHSGLFNYDAVNEIETLHDIMYSRE